MSRLRLAKLIMSGGSVINTVSEVLNGADLAGAEFVGFYIVGSAGVSAGAIQIEDAHSSIYTGTWNPQGSPVTVVADSVKKISITDVFSGLRARISTGLVGGTVDVYIVVRG
jgi:hypothetical protein